MKIRTPIYALLLFGSSLSYGQNTNISGGALYEGEPFIVQNPVFPQRLIAAYMGFKLGEQIVIKTKSSFTSGLTWTGEVSIPHVSSTFKSADPSLAYDHLGNVYLCYIDFRETPDSGAVYVRKSTDDGLTWGSANKVIDFYDDPTHKPIDRPWMAIDRSSGPGQGDIYVTTMSVKGASPAYHPYYCTSSDEGATWAPWKYLDTTNWLAGSLVTQPMPSPVVSTNGTFHATYPSYVPSQSVYPQLLLASSSNGGTSFSRSVVHTTQSPFSDTLAKKAQLLLADPTDPNHLAVLFMQQPFGDADVFLKESSNGGSTWASEIRVNDDAQGNDVMQDLVWADFDSNGNLAMAWRDRRNGSDSTYSTSSEIWGAIFWNDSSTVSANFPISSQVVAYDSVLAGSGNDFLSVAFENDTMHTVWGDTRTGVINIYHAQKSFTTGVSSIQRIASEPAPGFYFSPNPANTYIVLSERVDELVSIRALNGDLVHQSSGKTPKKRIEIDHISPGLYILTLKIGQQLVKERLVKH